MRALIDMSMNMSSQREFNNNCAAAISKVGNGSRKALVEACNEILDESLAQVPVDTATLMDSAFYEITGHWKTGWDAVIAYGGNGDPVNPKTGRPASRYMVEVHEDLSVNHVLGKAKFLEDPIREYAKERFPRTVIMNMQEAINSVGK